MPSNFDIISPLDGRYQAITRELAKITSEKALMHNRIIVEIAWLESLSENPNIACPKINQATKIAFSALKKELTNSQAESIKAIEKTTLHDVKACEYFLRTIVAEHGNSDLIPWIHFACTSEDINNAAYAMMLEQLRASLIVKQLINLSSTIEKIATTHKEEVMLAFTHGQAASPTTFGKEMAVFSHRLNPIIRKIGKFKFSAKFNGAVGNHNAHFSAYPDLDWPLICQEMLKKLGLEYNELSTQISNHDNLVSFLSLHKQAMMIIQDLCQDLWLYAHKDYIKLKKASADQVGSSTMPHKINPINFENAEGNIGMYKAICNQLTDKLPISRLQRDLSDSTTLRNIGTCFAYADVAISACLKGLEQISTNRQVLEHELSQHWEVLTEAVQTIMRKHGHQDAYEQLKAASQGSKMSESDFKSMLKKLAVDDKTQAELAALNPSTYIGRAIAATDLALSTALLKKLILDK